MEAKKSVSLNKVTVLIDLSSSNTCICFSITAAALGIRLMVVLPETMSV